MMTLPLADRSLHWCTWDLLEQIMQSTDGEHRDQTRGDVTERGLCIAGGRSDIRALSKRGWIETWGVGELFDDDGNSRVLPLWTVTTIGRAVLAAHAECTERCNHCKACGRGITGATKRGGPEWE